MFSKTVHRKRKHSRTETEDILLKTLALNTLALRKMFSKTVHKSRTKVEGILLNQSRTEAEDILLNNFFKSQNVENLEKCFRRQFTEDILLKKLVISASYYTEYSSFKNMFTNIMVFRLRYKLTIRKIPSIG